jgi:hypothetical protein
VSAQRVGGRHELITDVGRRCRRGVLRVGRDAFRHGTPEAVSDESLQRVLSAAVRLYAAKSEDRARSSRPSATSR